MDRHDVSDVVTAENVAQLHKEDLKIQHEFNCRSLTYWFDDTKKIAFCLVEAPNIESIREMHAHAHGEVPNQIIEVDSSLVETFLGRIEDPHSSSQDEMNIINDPAQRTLINIQFIVTDLMGFSPSNYKDFLQQAIQSMHQLLVDYSGRIVQQKDGNTLISFKSIYQAVGFSIKIKSLFGENNTTSKFDIKYGISTGMPVNNSKVLFEETIKMANCLCYVNNDRIVVSNEVLNSFVIEKTAKSHEINKLYQLSLNDEIFLYQLIEFIEKEWHDKGLKVEDFGLSMGMSKTLIYKKMVSITGQSPNSFLKEYRLNRALEEINLKTRNISELAIETGFNSTSYFSKCFQKRFKVLPSIYIKS
jgi:AraC-like DNA-binding protein